MSFPGEDLSRIFKDLTRSSWGPLRILLRIFMRIFGKSLKIFKILVKIFIFLPRSSGIFKVLVKIFKDLLFSCQDPWGSCTDLWRFFKNIWKFFEDLPNSCYYRSLRISIFLQGSSRIFYFPAKILNNLVINLQRSCWKFWRFLKILARNWKIFEDLGNKKKDPWRFWHAI